MKNKILKKCLLFVAILFAILLFSNSNVFAATINVNSQSDYTSNMTINEETTLKLTNDISLEGLYYNTDKLEISANLIIDLNGHTLTVPGNSSIYLNYRGNHNVTIKDSSVAKSGMIVRTGEESSIVLADNSSTVTDVTLNIEGIKYKNSGTNSYPEIYDLFGNADQTVNVNIKDSIFEVGVSLYYGHSAIDASFPSTLNLDIKNSTVKSKRINTNVYIMTNNPTLTFADIMAEGTGEYNYEAYGDGVKLSDTQVLGSTGYKKIEIKKAQRFDIEVPTFADQSEGYASIAPQNIKITAIGDSRRISRVELNSDAEFELVGVDSAGVYLLEDEIDTTATIKPKDGLSYGLHTAIIKVRDTEGCVFTEEVSFNVLPPAGTQIVKTAQELKDAFENNAVDKIKLGANITAENLYFYVNEDRILDLNGFTLELNKMDSFAHFGNLSIHFMGQETTVQIVDSSTNKYGKIIGGIKAVTNESNFSSKIYTLDINDIKLETIKNAGQYSLISLDLENDDYWDNTDQFNLIVNNVTLEHFGASDLKSAIGIYNQAGLEENVDISFGNLTYINNDASSKGLIYGNNVKYYKVSDIIDESYELESSSYLGNDPYSNPIFEKKIANRNDLVDNLPYDIHSSRGCLWISAGHNTMVIRKKAGFEVTAPTFANATYGYEDITAEAIAIAAIGPDRTIDYVDIDNHTDFIFTGLELSDEHLVSSSTPNIIATIKPAYGLNAGTYTTTIKVVDIDNNEYYAPVTFVVGKANIAPSVSIDDWVYDSTASNPSVNGNTGTGTETFKYVGTDSTSYDSTTKPTNAGTYKVIATIGETDNYNGATCEDTFEITKKIINVDNSKLTINSKNFDDTTDVEATSTGAYSELSNQITTTATMDSAYDKFVGAKKGTITATLSDTAYNNYSFADNSKTHTKTNVDFNINALTSTLTDVSSGNSEVVKTIGKDLRTLISLNPEAYKDDVTFAIDGSFTGVSLNADGYTLQADNTAVTDTSVRVNVNFAGKDLDGSSDKEYNAATQISIYVKVVDKPSQTFNETASTINMTYGDERSNPYTLSTGNGVISYSTSDNNSVSVDNAGKLTAKKVTNSPVTITVTAQETATHAETSLTYEVNVSVKDVTVSAGTYKVTKTYDGTATKVAGTGTLDIDGILPTDTGVTVVATTNDFSKSDVYNTNESVSLALSGTGSDNYNLTNSTLSVPYSITPKTITPTIEITGTYTYTGTAITPTYTVKVGTDVINANQYTARFEDNIDADTNAKVIVTANNDANYTWTEKTQTFTIGKANYTGTITALNKQVLENKEESYEIGLEEITLPTGFVNASIANATKSGELIKSVSKTSSKVTYISESKPADTTGTLTITISSKNYNDKDVTVNVTAVSKTLVAISGLTYTDRDFNNQAIAPTGTLTADNGYDVDNLEVLYEGVSPTVYSNTQAPTNAGTYKVTYKVPDSDPTYTGSKVWTFTINKINPTYTVPAGLEGVIGNKLSSITLPDKFSWKVPTTDLIAGNQTYLAIYTPSAEEQINYNIVNDISVNVYTKNKYDVTTSVVGGNGTISASLNDILEGTSQEITFTPNTGYMIDEVLVDDGNGDADKTSDVSANKITLTVDSDITVKVSYKKIPFTLTVEEVTGATITPNGTINVEYGDNEEITITANHGYILKSIKVNDVEKIDDLVADKLQINNITANTVVKVTVEKIVYDVIEGENQTHTLNKDEDATFRIDADYSLFDEVYVDGNLLGTDEYTSKSGSTIITLDKDYLDTLSEGEHTLKATFTDGGEAKAKFKIAKQEQAPIQEDNNDGNKDTTNTTDTNKTNPKTGDNVVMYSIVFIVALLGITTVYILAKKKRQIKK